MISPSFADKRASTAEIPDWHSSYGVDCDSNSLRQLIYVGDLVFWSFQIARGMAFLASRNIVHGDLAARNVMLAKDNVVKICDFGLAPAIYGKGKCRKNSPELGWLALESISDSLFTTDSDVWAFGVVMWEIFSLGRTPYCDMSENQNLFEQLRNGQRVKT